MESVQLDSRIANAIQLLKENPCPSLPELASHCKISSSRLSHLFKQETGSTLEQYRRNYRLQEAVRMLNITDMSIKEIAYHLGYQHTSSFVRAFKAEFELSPTHYRKRLDIGDAA